MMDARVCLGRLTVLSALCLAAGCPPGKTTPDPCLSFDDLDDALDAGSFSIEGDAISELEDFETTIQEYMWDYGIPNAGVAVVAGDDRLVLNRSYTNECGGRDDGGTLNHGLISTTTTDSRFRIASVTKLLTATTLVALTEEAGASLTLGDPVYNYVGMTALADSDGDSITDTAPPELNLITLRHLLKHQGGWVCRSPECSGSPYVGDVGKMDFEIQDGYLRVGTPLSLPLSIDEVVGYASGLPLAWDPGTDADGDGRADSCYCNYGYLLLGNVIESYTGDDYVDVVEDKVFSKLEDHAFSGGRTEESERQTNEVRYFYKDMTTEPSVVNPFAVVSPPYGRFNLENRRSNGGWIARASDLVAFGRAFMRGDLVSSPTSVISDGLSWSSGFRSRTDATGHTGSMEGTHAILMCHGANDANTVLAGLCWSFLFNKSPPAGEEIILPDGTREAVDPRNVMAEELVNQVLDNLTSLGTDDYW